MRKTKERVVKTTRTSTARKAVEAAPSDDGSMQDIADQVMGLIAQIQAGIPGFVPYDTNDAKRVAAAARFAPDLVPQVIATVTALPPVGGVNTFDVEEGKAALAFNEAMKPIIQALSSLLDGVKFTVDKRKARSASQALSTFAWGKKHIKGPDGVALRPYMDEMTRTIKKILNRRKPSPSKPPAPAPTGAQGFLSPNLAAVKPVDDDDDLPEDLRKALEEALKD
jgi:hypothetical protein